MRDRVAGARDTGRRYADAAREATERAEDSSPLFARAAAIVRRDYSRLGALLAGALAFRFFMWLLPFTLMVVGIFGALRLVDAGSVRDFNATFGLQRVLADVLVDGSSQRGWWVALLVGLVGTAYAGMGAVRALRVMHAAAWGVPPTRGGWSPLVASAALFAVILLLMAATGVVAYVRHQSMFGGLLSALLMTGVYYALWMWIAARLPRPEGVPVRALRPGALALAIGLQGVHLFTVYVLSARIEHATSVYGAIGAALVLLLWLYVVARMVVGASMLNAELAGATRPTWRAREDAERDV